MKTTAKTPLFINPAILKEGANSLRAVNHRLRKQMLMIIHQHEKITANEIYSIMCLPSTIGFYHLAVLRKYRYVIIQVHYTHVYYTLNYQRISDIQMLSKKLVNKQPAKKF